MNEGIKDMKIGSFEFSMRELSGSMGDFGTLLPLAVGYISVCGLNPAGLLVMIGLANIFTGLAYRLPIPIEPMKAIAVVAIAQHWNPSLVYATGFCMGILWLLLSATTIMDRVAGFTPTSVTRGIQVALGVMLAVQALSMFNGSWLLGLACIAIILLLRSNPYLPAAVVLIALGILIMFIKGQLGGVTFAGPVLPAVTAFHPLEMWEGMVGAGFAQIPLTATNAIIVTAAMIKTYWPQRDVGVRQLSLSTGLMNLVSPFFGGMPMCHGAGGLAGQYYFGARTGGANIIEGTIEVGLGILLATSIANLFTLFPGPVIGSMMLLVGIQLVGFDRKPAFDRNLIPLAVTVAVSLLTNMAFGFLSGVIAHFGLKKLLGS
ncbi:MAG TPA: putative sulfate/molybdate transporter [Deltaproteobacteria bacterium]|nr:putative sulfate/molybdate transporter [Deltaproteobacteria bacterium]HPV29554.1 putative sulfate/molybdate transporter [Deltaproteobacteria bacterium]